VRIRQTVERIAQTKTPRRGRLMQGLREGLQGEWQDPVEFATETMWQNDTMAVKVMRALYRTPTDLLHESVVLAAEYPDTYWDSDEAVWDTLTNWALELAPKGINLL
jgi:hypothetical protein